MNEDDAPRGFTRKYFDLEPELNDWLTGAARNAGQSMRVYIRSLILKEKQSQEAQRGKGKK